LAAVSDRADTLSVYLDYLARANRLGPAKEVWSRIVTGSRLVDIGAALHYFDSLLYAHEVDEMIRVWSDLAHLYPDHVQFKSPEPNLITNGSFEAPLLNGGFDWRTTPIEGAAVFVDGAVAHGGTQSLCIVFDGSRNVEFTHIVQYVAVEPNSGYRFSAYVRGDRITTDSGPRFAIYDAFDKRELWVETANLTGSFDWQQQELDFATGPDTRLIVVQALRPPSHKLDNEIAGSVWFDDVTLTKRSN